ncbi:3-hydroxybutyryl-CoA dehydrogenase [Piscinibacter sakaiensis]|uniref:3-hydroxybutyryl-CoA dehydrogenase n=1 Tax=Piscinibacter sakaiensis TaxID=1547922 RepID=UPI003AAEC45D
MNAPAIACVGAGRMGRGIAIAFAYAGQPVALIDLKPRSDADWQRLSADAIGEITASLQALAKLGAVPADAVERIASRVSIVRNDDADAALAAAQTIFEGVPETLEAKREALARVCAAADAGAIIASTTSTILVTDLIPMVNHPERLINAHWLNPAYIIPLVELSAHDGTSTEVRERLAALLHGIGKTTVMCGPTPGYIVPRLQALIMNEAARMVDEGVATAEDIDIATRQGLGLRFAAIGVVEFIDFGGNDILYHASRYMSRTLSAERYTAPPVVDRMMAEGRNGLKSGAGFYDYAGKDIPAYRLDVLDRTLGMLRHAGLFKPPVLD